MNAIYRSNDAVRHCVSPVAEKTASFPWLFPLGSLREDPMLSFPHLFHWYSSPYPWEVKLVLRPEGQAFILPITLGRGTPMNSQPLPKVPHSIRGWIWKCSLWCHYVTGDSDIPLLKSLCLWVAGFRGKQQAWSMCLLFHCRGLY